MLAQSLSISVCVYPADATPVHKLLGFALDKDQQWPSRARRCLELRTVEEDVAPLYRACLCKDMKDWAERLALFRASSPCATF